MVRQRAGGKRQGDSRNSGNTWSVNKGVASPEPKSYERGRASIPSRLTLFSTEVCPLTHPPAGTHLRCHPTCYPNPCTWKAGQAIPTRGRKLSPELGDGEGVRHTVLSRSFQLSSDDFATPLCYLRSKRTSFAPHPNTAVLPTSAQMSRSQSAHGHRSCIMTR
ncbi:hypothetical protein VTK26DRAFT_7115 [Humicola hyalothermophila]